jgi:hypothetical protein
VDDPQAVEESQWITDFREEFADFPPSSGGHDDQVDTASICYNYLFGEEATMISWGSQPSHVMHNGKLSLVMGVDPEADARIADLDYVYADGETSSSRPGSGKLVTGLVW